MKKVLFFNPFYLPGYKSGGPQQTIVNIVEHYGKDNQIYLITQDRDFGDTEKYTGIENEDWTDAYGIKIKYLDPRRYGYKEFKKEFNEFHTIYSCGLFEKSSLWILLFRRFDRIKDRVVYIAPMGVFSEGAFKQKKIKKTIFIRFAILAGLFNKIKWSFSSKREKEEAGLILGKGTIRDNYIIAEDLPQKINFNINRRRIAVNYGHSTLKIIYLSRITPKKNLDFCIEILRNIEDIDIKFDIYGVVDNQGYFNQCMKKIKLLGANIVCEYKGVVDHQDVNDVFLQYDIFLFPTKGENFGHVIYEALAAGCIPIISSETPWDSIKIKRCGYLLENENVNEYCSSIRKVNELDCMELYKMKMRSIDLAENKYRRSTSTSGYDAVFL